MTGLFRVPRGGNAHLGQLADAVGRPVAFLLRLAMRVSARRVGLALVYHRIGDPPGDPDRELVPARGTAQFRSELRHLKRCYRVVPASELLHAAAARRPGQRFPVAITFDDDLPAHAEIAMPILERHGVPATFFVGGTALQGPVTFWWESLQAAFDSGQENEAAAAVAQATNSTPGDGRPDIFELATRIEAMNREQRDAVSSRLREMATHEARHLTAGQLRELASRGFEIGFHTCRHDPLPSLQDTQLARALVEGRDEVAAAAGRYLTLIAYPHGRGDDRVAEAARAAGYRFGFAVVPEAVRPATDPLLVPRVGPTIRSSGRGALQIALILAGIRAGRKRRT
jgi:peptidoglycan/xylan/chitin deacetylase (PgdA/CDA1 family)